MLKIKFMKLLLINCQAESVSLCVCESVTQQCKNSQCLKRPNCLALPGLKCYHTSSAQ